MSSVFKAGNILSNSTLSYVRRLATGRHTSLTGTTVRIGCSSGFWGDSSVAGKFMH